MRGAFSEHPSRKREDPVGAGEFERDPPTHLPKDVVPAWHYVEERIPKVAIFNSDEVVVEMAARCLSGIWGMDGRGIYSCEFKRLFDGLMICVGKMGMSPVDRAKLASDSTKKAPNKFGQLKN
jgi:hypothetical protein